MRIDPEISDVCCINCKQNMLNKPLGCSIEVFGCPDSGRYRLCYRCRDFLLMTIGLGKTLARAGVESPKRCMDCDEAAKHAYSDATTPGFFSPKCAKHREKDWAK
jgi:hypothetical protein